MCGICGFYGLSSHAGDQRSALEGMNATLRHRGPDDTGLVILGDAGLAMSRLAVIDLTTGHQPVANEDQTHWIVCNGEIYNFLDVRAELEPRGHVFQTRSDTEVILHAYEQWGPECLSRLRGMFAFAILGGEGGSEDPARPLSPRHFPAAHDAGTSAGRPPVSLFLARDRLGKKPLFYYHDPERFLFASEIKALLAHPCVPRRVNSRVLPLYLAYGYVPAPDTMFEGIYELPPGHTLTIGQGRFGLRPYWEVPHSSDPRRQVSQQEAVELLRTLLQESVRLRLVSDVPLGAFLSGGIDSAAVVAIMARLMDRPVKTFSIGFEGDPSFDELAYARRIAHLHGTDHHEFVVQPDAVELLPRLVWHYDQPFADSSAIPTYLVSKLTREHVTVALTGDGGDELFAGYERFAAARVAETYRRSPRFIQRALAGLFQALPEPTSYGGFVRTARRFVENAPLPLVQRYLGWVGVFQPDTIRQFLIGAPEVDPVEMYQSHFDQVQEQDPVAQLLHVNLKTYLPGDLLVKTDRMAMANSLEARCPFLDQELLAFAAGLPTDLKLRGMTTKYILKKALEGIVPQEIIRRRKHGFGVPIGTWFRNELKDYVHDLLLSPQALQRGYFKEEAVRRLVSEHLNGQRDHGHRLWALLTLEIWHRVFIDQTQKGL